MCALHFIRCSLLIGLSPRAAYQPCTMAWHNRIVSATTCSRVELLPALFIQFSTYEVVCKGFAPVSNEPSPATQSPHWQRRMAVSSKPHRQHTPSVPLHRSAPRPANAITAAPHRGTKTWCRCQPCCGGHLPKHMLSASSQTHTHVSM